MIHVKRLAVGVAIIGGIFVAYILLFNFPIADIILLVGIILGICYAIGASVLEKNDETDGYDC